MIDLQLAQLIQAARAVLNQADNGELFEHQDPALANTCTAFDNLSDCVSKAEIALQQLNKGAMITLLNDPNATAGFTATLEFNGHFAPLNLCHSVATSLIGLLGMYGRPKVDVIYNYPSAVKKINASTFQRVSA